MAGEGLRCWWTGRQSYKELAIDNKVKRWSIIGRISEYKATYSFLVGLDKTHMTEHKAAL